MNADRKQAEKQYAVVKFLSDNMFSEIPVAWLYIEDNMEQCWWPPRTANTATLIANCASPDNNTWSIHEVEVLKYCCEYINLLLLFVLSLIISSCNYTLFHTRQCKHYEI